MKPQLSTFITEMQAIDQETNEIFLWEGPKIVTSTWFQAEIICKEQFPYLKVIGKLEEELPIYDDNTIIVNLNLN